MLTPQTWPCHVTREANLENNFFFPNSAFNIGKSYKISSRKTLYFRSYQPKTLTWVENTPCPSAFRVKTESLIGTEDPHSWNRVPKQSKHISLNLVTF